MIDKNRQHRRIEKNINLRFCVANDDQIKWDMSVIQNISAGGVKFSVPSDLNLKGQIIRLQIKIPELAPRFLDLEAVVLDAKPRFNAKYSDIRAKFINLSELSKEQLTIVERMIDRQLNKKS